MSDEIRGERFSYSDKDRLEVHIPQCNLCKHFIKAGQCSVLGEVPKAIRGNEVECKVFVHYTTA